MARKSPSRRTHRTDTHGLSAADFERLTTQMPEIAGAVLGPIQPDGDGFRAGDKRALVINANASFHDFRDDKHGYGPLALIQHLNGMDADGAVNYARHWLKSHEGKGRLTGAHDGVDGGGDAEQDIFRQAMIDAWWSDAQPITGRPAEIYLNSRGLKPSAEDLAQLRWRPDFRGPEGVLLAAIRDNDGELIGLQMTFITPSGQKSDVSPVRRTYKGPHNWGSRGAVRFGALTGKSVFICEGVEDALSVRVAGHGPAIAILGISRLGRLELPDSVERVIFVRDDDPAGSPSRAAMARGLVRLMATGCEVRSTALPDTVAGEGVPPLKDVNDLLRYDPGKVGELLTTHEPPLFARSNDLVEVALDLASILPLVEFERARDQLAKMCGLRLKVLERDREDRIKRRRDAAAQADAEVLPESETPWPDPVTDLGALLDAIVVELRRYVVAEPADFYAVAVWAVLTHVLQDERFGIIISPRLGIQSATPVCGKTTLMMCLNCLVPRSRLSTSITAASIFRSIASGKPTLLLDEADNLVGEECGPQLLGILNGGHNRLTAYAERTERTPDGNFVVVRFPSFAAIAFSGINEMKETLQTRSIIILLKRAGQGEQPEHLEDEVSPRLLELRRKLIRWAQDLSSLPAVARHPELLNRKGDNWKPLRRIAEVAGGEWPERILATALRRGTGGDASEADQNVATALLAALWEIFAIERKVRVDTPTLVHKLREMDEGRWEEANRGKPITEYYLREKLKLLIPHTPAARKAREWHEGGKKHRGYTEDLFEDSWFRYLGRPKPSMVEHILSPIAPGDPGHPEPPETDAKTDVKTDTYTVPDVVPDTVQNEARIRDTSKTPDDAPNGALSGTASGTAKNEPDQGLNDFVPDVPDVPDQKRGSEEGIYPKGARTRRKRNSNGVGDRP